MPGSRSPVRGAWPQTRRERILTGRGGDDGDTFDRRGEGAMANALLLELAQGFLKPDERLLDFSALQQRSTELRQHHALEIANACGTELGETGLEQLHGLQRKMLQPIRPSDLEQRVRDAACVPFALVAGQCKLEFVARSLIRSLANGE